MKCSKCKRKFNGDEYAIEFENGHVCMMCYRSIPYVKKFEDAQRLHNEEYEKKSRMIEIDVKRNV